MVVMFVYGVVKCVIRFVSISIRMMMVMLIYIWNWCIIERCDISGFG